VLESAVRWEPWLDWSGLSLERVWEKSDSVWEDLLGLPEEPSDQQSAEWSEPLKSAFESAKREQERQTEALTARQSHRCRPCLRHNLRQQNRFGSCQLL